MLHNTFFLVKMKSMIMKNKHTYKYQYAMPIITVSIPTLITQANLSIIYGSSHIDFSLLSLFIFDLFHWKNNKKKKCICWKVSKINAIHIVSTIVKYWFSSYAVFLDIRFFILMFRKHNFDFNARIELTTSSIQYQLQSASQARPGHCHS